MNKPLPSVDRIESARKILNAQASTLAELEAAKAVLDHVLAESDAEVEEMASRRKTIASADAAAGEIDKALERHDDGVRALMRRSEIAEAVAGKLAARIAADREADRTAKRIAAYDEARKIHDAATSRVKEFLDRIGREAREVMREYVRSEAKTYAANNDLPPGAARIPSIEFERKGTLHLAKTEVRHFKAFVDVNHRGARVAEQGYVEAAPGKDGKWEVFIRGGSTSSGYYLTCDLIDFVQVTTTTDDTPAPQNFAENLSVPAFYVGDPAWWQSLESPISHSEIKSALQRLESRPPRQYEPRVETRVMRLTDWRKANPDVGEAEPPRALAAE